MYFNMDDWSKEIIEARDVRYLPVLYFPCLDKAGYTVTETVTDGRKMAEVMASIIKRYPTIIAAMTGMDLSVDSEAFGAEVKFADRAVPSVKAAIVHDMAEAEALKVPDMNAGRIQVFVDAVKEAQKLITDRPIFGGQLGPFSLTANLLELSAAMRATIKQPKLLHTLLEKATDFLIKRALAYKEAGANGILLAEPTPGLLAPKQAAVFSDVYVKRLVDAVQDESFYVILHDCGNVTRMTDGMYGTGAKGLHFGNAVNMRQILSQLPQDVLVFGNIAPSDTVTATPDEISEQSLALLADCAEYPNYVFSTGCDVPINALPENLDRLASAVSGWNASRA